MTCNHRSLEDAFPSESELDVVKAAQLIQTSHNQGIIGGKSQFRNEVFLAFIELCFIPKCENTPSMHGHRPDTLTS